MYTITEQIKSLHSENSVNVSYDLDLSNMWFSEWKTELKDNLLMMRSGRDGTDYIVIGNLEKPYYSKSKLTRMKKDVLLDLANEYGLYYIDEFWTKRDIVLEMLSTITVGHHYKNHYENERWHNLECDFVIRGYCQGDAIRVNILDKEYAWNTEDFLTNLFYDTPISGVITFKGKEIYIEEILSDSYVFWDKSDFIERASKYYTDEDKAEFLEFLEYALPETLDYR